MPAFTCSPKSSYNGSEADKSGNCCNYRLCLSDSLLEGRFSAEKKYQPIGSVARCVCSANFRLGPALRTGGGGGGGGQHTQPSTDIPMGLTLPVPTATDNGPDSRAHSMCS